MELEWEVLGDGDYEITSRMKIAEGWLYLHSERTDGNLNVATAMVFVPAVHAPVMSAPESDSTDTAKPCAVPRV